MSDDTPDPDLAAFLAECAPLIDATVAMTGQPRAVYEAYLTAPPAPGVAWSTALPERKRSMLAGPLTPEQRRELGQLAPVPTTEPSRAKRAARAA